MVMELDYNRSLYGKEHLVGPFEVTKELIQAFTQSLGETSPIFTDEAAAVARRLSGAGGAANPVHGVGPSGVSAQHRPKVRQNASPCRPAGAASAPHCGRRPNYRVLTLEGRVRQDRPQRHYGVYCLGDHLPEPEWRSRGRRSGVFRQARMSPLRTGCSQGLGAQRHRHLCSAPWRPTNSAAIGA